MEQAHDLPTLPLDPRYRPATTDLYVQVRFIGNTASVSDITLGRVSVGHLDAAIGALTDARRKMQFMAEQAAEADAERKRIVTTGQLPPDGFRGVEGLRP